MRGAHAIFFSSDDVEVGTAPVEADCVIDAKSYTLRYTAKAAVQVSYVLVKVLPWQGYQRHKLWRPYYLAPGDTLTLEGDIHWDEPHASVGVPFWY